MSKLSTGTCARIGILLFEVKNVNEHYWGDSIYSQNYCIP